MQGKNVGGWRKKKEEEEFGRGVEYFTSTMNAVFRYGAPHSECVTVCTYVLTRVCQSCRDLPPTHSLITEFISHRVSNCLLSPVAVLHKVVGPPCYNFGRT